jgi:molybdopterin-containing oxidoreductase family membrane subunit
MAVVLGVLSDPTSTAKAIHDLKRSGFRDLDAYSPVPSHEIEEAMDKGPSIVRTWTLIGCLAGVTIGYGMPIWMSQNYPLVVGGKPISSIPIFTVIGFELNILFGVILTVVGLMFHGIWMTRRDRGVYRPTFSGDEFGCVVGCGSEQIERVQQLLRGAGAREVRVVEA